MIFKIKIKHKEHVFIETNYLIVESYTVRYKLNDFWYNENFEDIHMLLPNGEFVSAI